MLRPFFIALFELRRYLTNRGELAFNIALPIALFALMYGAFGGDESFHAIVDVVDLDGGVKSRDLIERLDALDEITVRERSLEEVDDALERSAILFAFVIREGFTEKVEFPYPTSIIFKRRGNGGDTGQIAAAIVRNVVDELASESFTRWQVADAFVDSEVTLDQINAELAAQWRIARQNPFVGVDVKRISEYEVDVLDRLIPGVVVMFLMFAVTLGAQTLVEERRIGTLERLMTTRLGINQLFAGKFLAGVVRATFQALFLLGLAFAVLRVGGILEFLQISVFSVLVASAVSAVGLVIGAAARTRDQAIWAAVFFTMFMTVFGGTFFDVGTGGALYVLSKFTINSYAIDSMHGMLSTSEGLGRQGLGIAVLVGVTIVGLAVARFIFKASAGGR